MDWDQVKGGWRRIVDRFRDRGRPPSAGEDLDIVGGPREARLDRIQARYGLSLEEARQHLAEWERKATDAWFTRPR